jgi:ferrous iron transport protein B
MTTLPDAGPAADPAADRMASVAIAAAERTLADTLAGVDVVVVAVDGDERQRVQLAAVGIWPGVCVRRIARALFGDPLLFRVHGYRLALRRAEARLVRVVEQRP